MPDETVTKQRRTRKKATVAPVAAVALPEKTETLEEISKMNTVTVAYNHPRSIIFDVVDKTGVKHEVLINGNATHLKGLDTGVLPTGGQYGLTFGVDAELWEAIKAKFGSMLIFKNGLIFATAPSDAGAAVEDHKSTRNGFEPVDTAKSKTQAANA